jgi:hypothetical protein
MDTPRTDKFMKDEESRQYPPHPYPIFDFARQLERENRELLEKLQQIDVEAIGWAYTKLLAYGTQNASMDNAMMMDRLNMMLLFDINGREDAKAEGK